jgi:hypothetical protein
MAGVHAARGSEITRRLATGNQHGDPLWIVHDLCNQDKHRALNLAVCAHKGLSIIIPMKNDLLDNCVRHVEQRIVHKFRPFFRPRTESA